MSANSGIFVDYDFVSNPNEKPNCEKKVLSIWGHSKQQSPFLKTAKVPQKTISFCFLRDEGSYLIVRHFLKSKILLLGFIFIQFHKLSLMSFFPPMPFAYPSS